MRYMTSRLPRSLTRRLRHDLAAAEEKDKRWTLAARRFFFPAGGDFLVFVSCYAGERGMVRRFRA